ncbi:unnamed protein product [Trichobilharzia regenti]|nr:unnamed protein product [Trichobilharzia regenti]
MFTTVVSIRTLLRYLRNETAECNIRRELGQLRIVSSDLVPLVRCCSENKILFELVIRLLMNLTQPAIICFRQEIPKDRDHYSAFLQVDDLLKSYKKRTDEDVSVHDQILWAMHLSGWDELLLFLGNSEDEQMFAFHTLEIISLMLREQVRFEQIFSEIMKKNFCSE